MDALLEVIQILILGIFDFFRNIYSFFLETSVGSFLSFFESSYDEFATSGVNIVDSFFARFDFTSEKFTDNFIYFFIGILFLLCSLKLCSVYFLFLFLHLFLQLVQHLMLPKKQLKVFYLFSDEVII